MAWFAYIGGAVTVAYCTYLFVSRLKRGVCKAVKQLDGKTVVITGANCGIGYNTALDLASRKARIILACRDEGKGKEAVESIQKQTGTNNIKLMLVDLTSFASVRKFAEKFNKEEERLDILINNAGLCLQGGKQVLTSDGIEMTYQVNHFSHFLLTLLLLDKLKASQQGRIIVLSSTAHTMTKSLDFEEFRGGGVSQGFGLYCNSKTCNVLFTRELARKLEGTGVTVNCLHPGAVFTNVFRHVATWFKVILIPIAWLFFRSVESGAQTSLHLALSDDVASVSGQYFDDCRPAQISSLASDDALARKLWEASEDITGQTL